MNACPHDAKQNTINGKSYVWSTSQGWAKHAIQLRALADASHHAYSVSLSIGIGRAQEIDRVFAKLGL